MYHIVNFFLFLFKAYVCVCVHIKYYNNKNKMRITFQNNGICKKKKY